MNIYSFHATQQQLGEGAKMKCQSLVSEEKYKGQYVALESFQNNTVVSSGSKPSEVILHAEKQGFKDTVLIFVPEKEMTHVY